MSSSVLQPGSLIGCMDGQHVIQLGHWQAVWTACPSAWVVHRWYEEHAVQPGSLIGCADSMSLSLLTDWLKGEGKTPGALNGLLTYAKWAQGAACRSGDQPAVGQSFPGPSPWGP